MFLWCSLSTENEQAVREKEWDAVEKSMPQMCFQSLNAHNRWFFARNKNINNCLWLHCFCLCEANAECWMLNAEYRLLWMCVCASTYNISSSFTHIYSDLRELLSVVAFLLKSDLHLATMCRSNWCWGFSLFLFRWFSVHALNRFSGTFFLQIPFRIGLISVVDHTLREPDQWFRRSLNSKKIFFLSIHIIQWHIIYQLNIIHFWTHRLYSGIWQ